MTLVVLLLFLFAALAMLALGTRAGLAVHAGVAALAASGVAIAVLGVGPSVPREERWQWVDGLGLALSFRLDGFAVVMGLLVAGLGATVLWYSSAYFEGENKSVRFVGLFVGFAAAMTGLVFASDLFTMFVFWELTSLFSFLLIGLNDRSASARSAALRALLVTGTGGLAFLAGIVLVDLAAGTTSFAVLAANPPSGAAIEVAGALVLVGAFTKSAQVPFHFWLPGAMAAPTPVSAYLHSATMVKAGIVLVARLAPAFGSRDSWRWTIVLVGGATMVSGGLRALRQVDAKLLLAHSTVSQLGFLTVLMGLGVPGATYAGVAHLVAHACFKAALFMAVGAVDHATGTRDLRRLSGVGRALPVLATATGLAAASMAGVLPMLGFATKEKALAVLLDDVGRAGSVALGFVVVGSMLSVAYSVRLWFGLFGTKRSTAAPSSVLVHHAPGVRLVAPVVMLGAASLGAGLLASRFGDSLRAAAESIDADASGHLALWPGFNLALAVSLGVVVVGALVGWRTRLDVVARPWPITGERVYESLLDGLLRGSRRITTVTQSGSLPAYLGIVMLVLIAVLGVAFALDPGAGSGSIVVADSLTQAVVASLTMVLTIAVAQARHRFASALLLGGVGFGLAVLFAQYGAPDLALTQILVETLTIVVFLLVLRQVPREFSPPPAWVPRSARLAISVAVGVGVAGFAMQVSGARTASSVGDQYRVLAAPGGGGNNVVNVILVDFRGFDTLGEITVLGVAAIGVANLVRVVVQARRAGAGVASLPARAPAECALVGDRRSVVLDEADRWLFPVVMLVSVFVTFRGHNAPGGGFAGGLVASCAFVLRYLAGGTLRMRRSAIARPAVFVGLGLALAATTALVPLASGDALLESAITTIDLPVIGTVKLVSSAIFDLGVYVLVIGAFLAVLTALGAEPDDASSSAEGHVGAAS